MAEDKTFFVMGCMGTKKIKIFINQDATMQEFSAKVEEVFCVSQNGQKIIFKGKLMSDPCTSLRSYNIKKGDCVMVLGKVIQKERDSLIKELEKFEQSFREQESAVGRIVQDGQDATGTQKKDSMKMLLLTSEKLMNLLESLDGMKIKLSCNELRGKRKSIVQGILTLMDRVDSDYKSLQSQTGSS